MLKGKNNRSGVTIGVGVDLGQQAPEAYKDRLRNFGIKQELIAKLEPYMGLIRGQAIEKLKEKPLSLSKQEMEQIVAEMKNEMPKDLVREYKDLTADIKNHRDFKELAIEEQTILFSRKWQNGSLRPAASQSIANLSLWAWFGTRLTSWFLPIIRGRKNESTRSMIILKPGCLAYMKKNTR